MWLAASDLGTNLAGLGGLLTGAAGLTGAIYGIRKHRQTRRVIEQAKLAVSTELTECRELTKDLQQDNERIRKRLREVETKYDQLNDRIWRAVEADAENKQLRKENEQLHAQLKRQPKPGRRGSGGRSSAP